MSDIEFDALTGQLMDEAAPSDDPGKASDEAEAKAIRLLIKKYHLPKNWKPDEELGASDPKTVLVHDRKQIVIANSDDAGASLKQLRDCLSSDEGQMWRGCQDNSLDYRFVP